MASEIPDKSLYELRNTDNIFLRNVVAGFLTILNNKLVYTQVWDDKKGDSENITVPFYFDLGKTSSEDFIQDNYIWFGEKCGIKKVAGNFDVIPRGMIKLASTTIQGDSVNNRWVMGKYQKEDPSTGEIESYVSYLYSLPLLLTFNIEIRCSKYGELLKIDQACREYFYKNKTFRILYKGMPVPCRAGYPDSFAGDVESNYTMGSEAQKDLTIQFDVQIETYQPVFDPTTEMKASNKISSFAFDVNTGNDPSQNKKTDIYGFGVNTAKDYSDPEKKLYIIDTPSGTIVPSDSSLLLKWNHVSSKSDMMTAKIEYSVNDSSKNNSDNDSSNGGNNGDSSNNHDCECDCDGNGHDSDNDSGSDSGNFQKNKDLENGETPKKLIAIVDNHQEYEWHIPSGFTDYKKADVIFTNNQDILVYKDPDIRILPQKNGLIKPENIDVLDDGYFMIVNPAVAKHDKSDTIDSSVTGIFSWDDKKGENQEQVFILEIENHKVKYGKGHIPLIHFTDSNLKPLAKQQFYYTGKFSSKNINIYISNPNDESFKTVIENVTVI